MSPNLEFENGWSAGYSLRGKLRACVSFVGFMTLLAAGLAAQTTPPPAPAQTPVVAYGSGVQTPLQFTGETAPANQVLLSMGVATFYDDNVLQTNLNRQSDEALSFTSQLAAYRQTDRLKVDFEYTPFFVLYRQVDQLDRLNHNANLNAVLQLSSHVNVRLQDAFTYQNGLYQSLSGQQILSGLGAPTALNESLNPYAIRTLANTVRLDLTYAKSGRTSFGFTSGFDRRQFGNQQIPGESLYNSWGVDGGLQYQYRATEHTTVGLFAVHQDSTFRGGQVFGQNLRFQSDSIFFSVSSRLSATVTATVFGGPQDVRIMGQTSGTAGTSAQVEPAGGGSITWEVQKTALELSAQRIVTDGGGFYTLVKNTNLDFGVRRRLVGQWQGSVHIDAARANTSLFQLASGTTDALIGVCGFYRPLGNAATLHATYETVHQLSKGVLLFPSFDRNRITIGVDYRFRSIPLGR